MNRGDVVRVDLPRPGSEGHEQFGERPALILQVDRATANLTTVVVVPINGNSAAIKLGGTVSVVATEENGLSKDSVALVHQVRAVDKKRILKIDGKLSGPVLREIEVMLQALLGL
jgi:mRNA interferase MazF